MPHNGESHRDRAPVLLAPAGPGDIPLVRTLFREYADWLGVDLTFQGFEEELQSLPGKYNPPEGTILIAWDRGEGRRAAGCVAVRPFDPGRCEMKRLWVREPFRGQGIGRSLALSIVEIAREIGYCEMVLDTLETMEPALQLYEICGFSRIPAYYNNPLSGVVYLSRRL